MLRDHTLYFSKLMEKQFVRNAKDTDLQRYAVILLLWLKNAAHFMQKFISWYRRSPQTITATSFLTSDTSKTVGRKGDQEKCSTQRRKGGRSKAQRSETVTTVQRAYAPPTVTAITTYMYKQIGCDQNGYPKVRLSSSLKIHASSLITQSSK